ncbi:protein BZR1 homolog 4-like [Euphorbia lathyris]|uniref:protein BZR1 homolog 4-like n=1 Tax=Euphorbia lathyris TaxID=212925 RepID=UPI003313D08D
MVGGSSTRSESEKEKTKLRERQRRGITTKIFHGLRRHGGYNLSPRADINEVLRELAKEAGWSVDPDGTTYRNKLVNRCPTCGAPPSTTATPTSSSTVIAMGGRARGRGFGGESSTTSSPLCVDSTMIINTNNSGEANATATSSPFICGDIEIPLAFYIYSGLNHNSTTTAMGGVEVATPSHHHQQEAMASNHNTPIGSPLHRTN